MLRGHKVSWFLAMTFIGAVASLAPGCGGGDQAAGGTGPVEGRCTPNDTKACLCPGGTMGVQTCNEAGSGFSVCDCGGTGGAGGGTGSGGSGMGGSTSSGPSDCGNGNIDPGECGPEGTCPMDCGKCGNMMEDPGECGPGGNCPIDCNPCKDAVTFAGIAPMPSGPKWTYAGVTGIDAGNKMCEAIGADHICTHAELKTAAAHVVNGQNEFLQKMVPAGTMIWLHREDIDIVDVGGKMVPGGPGGRCNDWKYETNHIGDGEWAEFDAAGNPTYHYDSDTVFDGANPGAHTQADLPCGGVTRSISCCFSACVP